MNISQVIQEIITDDKKRFRCLFNARVLFQNEYGEINWEDADDDEHLIIDEECLRSYQFSQINDPITFEEALKLWMSGETIECNVYFKDKDCVYVYGGSLDRTDELTTKQGHTVTPMQILTGVWRLSE